MYVNAELNKLMEEFVELFKEEMEKYRHEKVTLRIKEDIGYFANQDLYLLCLKKRWN